MKKPLLLGLSLILLLFISQACDDNNLSQQNSSEEINPIKSPKKTPEQRALFAEERARYEYELQRNPLTGEIPRDEKTLEFDNAKKAKIRTLTGDNLRAADAAFISRGPDNLGGRTRALVVDASDNTGNTIISGGVSSGVFRTTNGGTSWTKVSDNDEVHNVTAIAQDPSNHSTWYYGTGESLGNTASLGSFYLGDGIWTSTNSGVTWSQMTGTAGAHESYDSFFDIIFDMEVHPTTGDLFVACGGAIRRFDAGTSTWFTELANGSISSIMHTDIEITSSGRVFAAFSGNCDAGVEGVWTSSNGEGGWSRISNATIHTNLTARAVLGLAPSNQDKLYMVFDNGVVSDCAATATPEGELWMWDQSGTSWTDYSSKLPDELGCSDGNDPFAIQRGYDLVVSVKPDDEDFVVIGGTNAYKMADITAVGTFSRIGGYAGASGYSLYNTAGGDEHHPDIHAMVFNPFNNNVLFTGSDGGVHRTDNVTAGTVDWTTLNNDYVTQQFYHVGIDPLSGSDYVLGGLQDNGTNQGGTSAGFGDLTTQGRIIGGDGVAVALSRDGTCRPIFGGTQNGSLYRYRFCAPAGWSGNIQPSGSSSQFVTYFYLDPDNNTTMYYAGLNRVYRTNDATNVTATVGVGATDWTNMNTTATITGGSGSERISVFSTPRETYNSLTSYLLIGTNEGNIYRLDDPQNAANVSGAVNITPPAASAGTVTGLAVHPTNRDIVLATYANYGIINIFLTTNATSATPTWSNVEQNLSSHSIRSAAIVEANGDTMYLVGTARGLYSSLDPTQPSAWIREAPNLIGFAVVSSMAYRPVDGKLLIGTHGNGMFEATITQVLSLDENEFSQNLKIYPNPVSDVLNVKLTDYLGARASYSIHNLLGQTVSQGELKDERIDVSNLNTGLYFVEVSSEGKRGVKRFIKE